MNTSQLPLHRRTLLAAGIAALAAGPVSAASRKPFFRHRGLPLGIQLYTMGQEAATNLEGTLGALARVGYKTIELPGLLGRMPAQMKSALDAAGLSCTSMHVQVADDAGKLADDLHVLGAKYAVAPSPYIPARLDQKPGASEPIGMWFRRVVNEMTADDWKRNGDFLNERGAALAPHGVKIGYHNHNIELAPVDGTRRLDILIRHTDPKLVGFELDTGWVAAAGLDPAALLTAHRGRFHLIHLKDIQASSRPNFAMTMDPTQVGSGTLRWREILAAAYAAGVREFFVEQEPPFAVQRIEAARISYDYLMGVSA